MPQTASLFERHAATIKAFSVALLVLLLLIPLSMVESLIHEREQRRAEVVAEIAGKWGLDQQLAGPILKIPYSERVEDNRGRITRVERAVYLLPQQLEISGEMQPQVRYRGIFEAVLYETDLHLSGTFSFAALQKLNLDLSGLKLSDASLLIAISDIKGIKEEVAFRWGEHPLHFNPAASGKVMPAGVSARLEPLELQQEAAFQGKISLRGSRAVAFAPVGMTTRVNLRSDWSSPSFTGAFLPVAREVSPQGFAADWKVLHFNRGYPQAWLNDQYQPLCATFGVELLLTADAYQQAVRTLKYGVLFISLTFAAFFFSEMVNKVRVHPIQYLLVGFALVVFYTLLTAISEHIAFGWAYLIAALSVTLLVTGYARSVMGSAGMSGMVGGILLVLYLYLYFLLQLVDYALLFGSIGLFAVLTLVMYCTRRFDWYNLAVKPAQKL